MKACATVQLAKIKKNWDYLGLSLNISPEGICEAGSDETRFCEAKCVEKLFISQLPTSASSGQKNIGPV